MQMKKILRGKIILVVIDAVKEESVNLTHIIKYWKYDTIFS